ncbi:glycosyltransferase [Mycobacterium sp. IS-1496]|uniref:glycosyltransferase family 87 protein n=1 Tax=Mycobacterium sp. IS-1496 TaxID=1772284 RepID=UPI0007416401|nr:glycosyltransferase family 87 protein [Mycobacterium sp. IS-1496]KUI24543.1 glycosyltransferase [Mycobacterium sp. IS-1496]
MNGPSVDQVAEDDVHAPARSRRPWIRGLWLVGSLLAVGMIARYVVQAATGKLLDLSVFRDAGYAITANLPLYSEQFPSASGFRFIYPPFAAILFAPMAAVPQTALQIGWSALNLVLLWWILRTVLVRLRVRPSNLVALALLGPALILEPVRSNFEFGQVNIVLMALVIADCLGVLPRRLRGVGIGIAAGIKITPAAFGLVLLLRRDFAGAARALIAFGATVLIGFLARSQESLYFWATEFFRTDRAGGHEFSRNQALTGLITRWGAAGTTKEILWLVGVTAVIAAAVYAGHRFTRSGMPVVATAVVALAALLAAPLAVTHHWVYAVLLVPLMVAPQHRRWRPLLVAAGIVFVAGPHIVLPGPDVAGVEAVFRQVVGNAQAITGVALLIAAVIAARRTNPVKNGQIELMQKKPEKRSA